jgi:transcriptional regulator with PAS, ATPase and Fis domain
VREVHNWLALFLVIVKEELTVDKALIAMGIKPSNTTKGKRKEYRYHNFTDEEIQEMVRLREEKLSYKDIGEKFGISDRLVIAKIKKYKERIA